MSEGARYTILLQREAEKTLRNLRGPIAERIDTAINGLAETPRPPGCVKLTGYDDLYRVRVGDWRIVYQIRDSELIILVIEVRPRGAAYRNL